MKEEKKILEEYSDFKRRERLQIYKYMLHYLQKDKWRYIKDKAFGYCEIISKVHQEHNEVVIYSIYGLPELLKYRPSNKVVHNVIVLPLYHKYCGYWFCAGPLGYWKRVRILKKIIKKLEKEL